MFLLGLRVADEEELFGAAWEGSVEGQVVR
jgi:hypothetical protein